MLRSGGKRTRHTKLRALSREEQEDEVEVRLSKELD